MRKIKANRTVPSSGAMVMIFNAPQVFAAASAGDFGSWFFYGYGLGRMDDMNILTLNLFAIAIFAALALFSRLWLAVFPFGPAEWLWRRLSYSRPLSGKSLA